MPGSILKDGQPAPGALTGRAMPSAGHADRLAPPAVRLPVCGAIAVIAATCLLRSGQTLQLWADCESAFAGAVADAGPKRVYKLVNQPQVRSAWRYLLLARALITVCLPALV